MDESAETLTKRRDSLNSRVKELIFKSKDISARIGQMHDLSDPLKEQEKKMDRIASALQKNLKNIKKEKKALVKKLKTIALGLDSFGKDKTVDFKKMHEEMKMLDWMVQTEVMSPKKEDALSRKVIDLEKRLRGYKQYAKIKEETDALQDKIDNITYMSDMHSDLITDTLDRKYKIQGEIFKNMRKLKKEHIRLKKTNDSISKAKKEADAAHGELMSILKTRKAEKVVHQKQKEEDIKKARKKEEKDIEKSHDNLFEELKKKKKISLG